MRIFRIFRRSKIKSSLIAKKMSENREKEAGRGKEERKRKKSKVMSSQEFPNLNPRSLTCRGQCGTLAWDGSPRILPLLCLGNQGQEAVDHWRGLGDLEILGAGRGRKSPDSFFFFINNFH